MRITLLFIVHFLMCGYSVFAQINHGQVTYVVRFEDAELSEEELSMFPSEAVIVFRADRMRMNMSIGMGMESSVIVHKDQVHVLMDVMGNKFAMRTSKGEIRKDPKSLDTYRLKQLTDEYKDIAGYRCRKAVLGADQQEDMSVWYTDRLRTSATWYYQMDGLDGFPMEFDLKTTGMAVRMSAKAVREDTPSDDVFVVGGEYRMIKQEELNKMLGVGR